MAVDVMRTIASVGSWMEGSGTSWTLSERRPCHVTAFTIGSPWRFGWVGPSLLETLPAKQSWQFSTRMPTLDTAGGRAYIVAMSDEPNTTDGAPPEAPKPPVPPAVEHDKGDAGTGDFTTEVDPTFIPDERKETPEEQRAREHPEATGS